MMMVSTVMMTMVAQVSTFHTRPLRYSPMMWRSWAMNSRKTSSTGSSTPLMTCALIMIWNRLMPGMITSRAEATMTAVMMPR